MRLHRTGVTAGRAPLSAAITLSTFWQFSPVLRPGHEPGRSLFKPNLSPRPVCCWVQRRRGFPLYAVEQTFPVRDPERSSFSFCPLIEARNCRNLFPRSTAARKPRILAVKRQGPA